MPSITVSDNVTFEYSDSGHIDDVEYATCVIVHGHSFHGGVFQRLFTYAKDNSLRIICVNRRAYPGSTPYTDEDIKVINHGTNEQCTTFLQEQGVLLSLFVDGIIQKHSLPQKGGVALVAWSMGNLFAMCMLASLPHLPLDARDRLAAYVHTYIAWDPPSVAIGIPEPKDSYNPLWSDRVPMEDRGRMFGIWVSGYFVHTDLNTKDISKLNQTNFDESRRPTISKMTREEVECTTSVAAAVALDTPLVAPGGRFESAARDMAAKALLGGETRKAWNRLKICLMYGEDNAWPIIYGTWMLEKIREEANIQFRPIPGANHFLMWDDPKLSVSMLKECMSG